MCGIVAYVGRAQCVDILMNGLRRLEYRGYDSAGYLTLDDGFHLHKVKGGVDGLKATASGTTGIAHTRWATHGAPSALNAHPHLDSTGKFAIVHNGIIENAEYLCEELVERGVTCHSETDSELFAHLVSRYYSHSLFEAVKKACARVQGAYAVLVVSSFDPDTIVAAKRGSPLVLGVADDARFIASDVSAVVEHTRSVVYLEDGDICELCPSSHRIENLHGDACSRDISKIDWDISAQQKSGFDHFMLKEIYEQPVALKNSLAGRMRKILEFGYLPQLNIPDAKRFVILACGTSWHAGLIAKHYIESMCSLPVEVDYASEFRYRRAPLSSDDVVIAISQSGETADTLEAVKLAKQKGAYTLGIVNVVGSSIARLVDEGLYIHAGPEIGVASTKAFTTQLLSLLLVSTSIALSQGKLSLEEVRRLDDALKNLPVLVEDALLLHDTIKDVAKQFSKADNALFMGRGLFFPVALEGALKLKEISYVHAEGLPAAEMKHGPIALIDENMPVVFCALEDDLLDKVISNMQEVKARKGKIVAITDCDDSRIADIADVLVRIPKTHPLLKPILASVPLQLFAYESAIIRGLSPDKPRNLAKSVTVE